MNRISQPAINEEWLSEGAFITMEIKVKPYKLKDLCKLYNYSAKVMRANIKAIEEEVGPRIGHFYNIKQVIIIFNKYGLPHSIHERDQ